MKKEEELTKKLSHIDLQTNREKGKKEIFRRQKIFRVKRHLTILSVSVSPHHSNVENQGFFFTHLRKEVRVEWGGVRGGVTRTRTGFGASVCNFHFFLIQYKYTFEQAIYAFNFCLIRNGFQVVKSCCFRGWRVEDILKS